jgi:hypothetical protein
MCKDNKLTYNIKIYYNIFTFIYFLLKSNCFFSKLIIPISIYHIIQN